MASFSEIEGWLSILGTGMAGLRLLKEYGIRTSELQYFMEHLGDCRTQVSAFAPSTLKNQYEPLIVKAETKLISGLKKISKPDVTDEVVDDVLRDARELYSLLSDMHQATASGFIVV